MIIREVLLATTLQKRLAGTAAPNEIVTEEISVRLDQQDSNGQGTKLIRHVLGQFPVLIDRIVRVIETGRPKGNFVREGIQIFSQLHKLTLGKRALTFVIR